MEIYLCAVPTCLWYITPSQYQSSIYILINWYSYTCQGTNISHHGKRIINFKSDFWWDMLVPRRVYHSFIKLFCVFHMAGCTVWSSSTSTALGMDRAKTLRSGAMEEGCRRKACHLIRVQFDLRWIELVLLMIFMHIFVWSHSGFELSRHEQICTVSQAVRYFHL